MSITSSGGDVTFTGTINSDSSSTPRSLDVNAGSGTISFLSSIGQTASLNEVYVTSTTAIYIGGSVTTSAGLRVYDSTIRGWTYDYREYDSFLAGGVNFGDYTMPSRDNFKLSFSGYLIAPETGTYTFKVAVDDWLDLRLGKAGESYATLYANRDNSAYITLAYSTPNCCAYRETGSFSLIKGQAYPLFAAFREDVGGQAALVQYKYTTTAGTSVSYAQIPTTLLYSGRGIQFNGPVILINNAT